MEKEKNKRIAKEKRRLNKIYAMIEDNKKQVVAGLIERAAFMRVQLEDLEADLNENGWTEDFQQSEKCAPYERQRPSGQSYISLNSNYQKIIKMLVDALPEESNKEAADELMRFVSGRK